MQQLPSFNTPEYWQALSRGQISWEQAARDEGACEQRRKRARDSKHNKAALLNRHMRPAPHESKQFAKPMATTAARDDRLTPQAKALLQIIVARTGKERMTDTCKTTLGIIINRCPRSVQRYLGELVKFGYIRTQIKKSRRSGLYTGLRIWIMNSVLPYFTEADAQYEPSKWYDLLVSRRKSEETKESPINNINILSSLLGDKKPPWFNDFTFA